MLVPVFVRQQNGVFAATVPDLPAFRLEDPDEGLAIARLRLAIEGALVDLLIAGRLPPAVSNINDLRGDQRYRDGRWYDVHFNLAHVEAVARHQSRQRG
jgi:hypothetical protein